MSSAVVTIDFQFPGSSTLTRLTIPESKAMPSIESFDLSEKQERWVTMLDHVANALASENWQPRVVSVADSAWNTSNKHQSCCRKCQQYHRRGSDRPGLWPGEQTWNWKCPLIEKESPLQSTLALILVFGCVVAMTLCYFYHYHDGAILSTGMDSFSLWSQKCTSKKCM